MARSKFPRSVAKYVRRQKSIIRRQVSDKKQQDELIRSLLTQIESSRKNT